MIRLLTLALLASTALPAAASAQEDNERPRTGMERREAAAQRIERGPRPERAAPADRGPRMERGARSETRAFAPSPGPGPAAGGWQGRRDGNRGGEVRGNRGRGDGSFTAPGFGPSAAREVPGNDAWNQTLRSDRTGRGGAINRARDEQRRGWDRRRDDDRRNWDRNGRGRDWNGRDRNDWNRDGRRWDDNRNGRGWNDGRGWNGNSGWNGGRGNWDRNWRSDRRYDWQRYRSSNRYAFRLPRYYAPSGWHYGYRPYSIGATLFAGLFAQSYWIGDPWAYRLPPAQWPYQWVRYYDDALLVDTRSGYVVDSIPGIFW